MRQYIRMKGIEARKMGLNDVTHYLAHVYFISFLFSDYFMFLAALKLLLNSRHTASNILYVITLYRIRKVGMN
jgi:hypothetical protein